MGGHGERLTQCREVLLTTSKAIPVQVDGEPCKLAASRIRISLRNQATMVQKAKRRSAAPLHSEYAPPQPRFSHLEMRLTVPRGSWVGLGAWRGREAQESPCRVLCGRPARSQQPVPEQLRIQVSRVSMHDYEALHYDKEQLKEACEWRTGGLGAPRSAGSPEGRAVGAAGC